MVDKNDASNYRKVLEKRICKNKNIFDKYTPELRFITLDFKFLSYLRSILIFSEMKIDLTHINPFLEKDIVNELEYLQKNRCRQRLPRLGEFALRNRRKPARRHRKNRCRPAQKV